MLSRLSISNYALINELSVEFNRGLNTLTGETGAGKSIILGALGLILGNRADLSVLKDKTLKCIVEGQFEISLYKLQWFFDQNDLDYDEQTIFRREITPSGKSRAFINDTPVNLKVIRELGLQLIDIHSQHQNLELSKHLFQLNLVDTVASASSILFDYQMLYSEYKVLQKELEDLKVKSEKANADLDYFQFQFNQLDEASLKENEQEEMEAELSRLSHAEEIKTAFTQVQQLLDDEQLSVLHSVKESGKSLEKIATYSKDADELSKRLESSFFELQDIVAEAEGLAQDIEHDPARVEQVNERLNLIYGLQQKHNVASVKELIHLKNSFDEKVNTVIGYESRILKKEDEIKNKKQKLEQRASQLTKKRLKAFPKIEKSVVADLKQLGMPKSKFIIEHQPLSEFTSYGRDSVSILFSANSDSLSSESCFIEVKVFPFSSYL